MKRKVEYVQQDFVLEYLKNRHVTNFYDEDFHNEFFARFGGKRIPLVLGYGPVIKAQRLLARMYRCNLLDRGVLSICDNPTGFANWTYVYTLKG